LSALLRAKIESIRGVLRGDVLRPLRQPLKSPAPNPTDTCKPCRLAMQRLGFASLLASKACRERDLVVAMVASRIIAFSHQTGHHALWHTTTLAEEFGVAHASEDDLYAAMDWLHARQGTIEKKLAARHLHDDALVLYDLSSSYFEGIAVSSRVGATAVTAPGHAAGQLWAAHRCAGLPGGRCRCTRATPQTARRSCRRCTPAR
jgi:hypothetical protein